MKLFTLGIWITGLSWLKAVWKLIDWLFRLSFDYWTKSVYSDHHLNNWQKVSIQITIWIIDKKCLLFWSLFQYVCHGRFRFVLEDLGFFALSYVLNPRGTSDLSRRIEKDWSLRCFFFYRNESKGMLWY